MTIRHLLVITGLQMLAHLVRGHLRVRSRAQGQNLEEQDAIRPAVEESFSYRTSHNLWSISIEKTLCIYTLRLY